MTPMPKKKISLINMKFKAKKAIDFADAKIKLCKEYYLKGERISQVAFAGNTEIESRNALLLVSVWDKSGYYLIDRVENKVTPVDSCNKKDQFCTDLTALDPLLDTFFVARSSQSLSLIDVSTAKVYPLIASPNPVQKYSKLSVIRHETTDLDKVKITLVYTTEVSRQEFEKTPKQLQIVPSWDEKSQFKFKKI